MLSSKKNTGEDLWTLLDKEPTEGNDDGDTITLFVGDRILSGYSCEL